MAVCCVCVRWQLVAGSGQLVESRTYGTHDVRRTYDFDSLGRPEVSRVQVDTGTWYEVVSEYDARMGRLKALGYPAGLRWPMVIISMDIVKV